MYTINSISIENDVLVSHVSITMKDGHALAVTVPVKLPKTKDDVLAAIGVREKLEIAKYDAAPTLSVVKADLERESVGKAMTSIEAVK